MQVLSQEALPLSVIARELIGEEVGAGVCLLFVDAPPGKRISLHTHPYEEIFIILEGEAAFFGADGSERIVRGGEIAIVPADQPHGFRNVGDGTLRQIDIHVSERFETVWLEG